MELFGELKSEILRRAHNANPCVEQYKRALESTNMQELCEVIKDNFIWCCYNNVIDGGILEKYKDDFVHEDIFYNENVERGFLLATATVEACGNATVWACGNATVEANGNAKVWAYGNATVEANGNATVWANGNATVWANGNATVEACGNATVRVYGNAKVMAYDNVYIYANSSIECKLNDEAIVYRYDTSTIQYVSDKLKFEKLGDAAPLP